MSKRLLVKKRFFLAAVIAIIASTLTLNGIVSAAASEDAFKKILINGAKQCFQNAFVKNISYEEFTGFNSLMKDGYKQSNDEGVTSKILVPSLDDNLNKISNSENYISCYALFAGDKTWVNTLDGSMSGLFDIYNISVPSATLKEKNVSAVNRFMETLGYKVTNEGSSEEYCYTVYAKENTTAAQEVELGEYCRNSDNYPISVYEGINITNQNEKYSVSAAYYSPYTHNSVGDPTLRFTIKDNNQTCYGGSGYSMIPCQVDIDFGTGIPTVGTKEASYGTYYVTHPSLYVKVTKKSGSADSKNTTYTLEDRTEAYNDFVGDLGFNGQVPFTNAEKYNLYIQYLTENYGKSGTAIGSSSCVGTKPATLADTANNKYYIHINGSGWCEANLDNNKLSRTVNMNVFSATDSNHPNSYLLGTSVSDLSGIINKLGELDYSDEEGMEDIEDGASVTEGDDGGRTPAKEDPCYNAGDSLGWWLCPTMNMIGDALGDLYENVVEPFLQMDTNSVENGRGAWETVLGIANTLLIIFFMVVIFSQLTGVGIDNYGIKKILPKIIVVGVLINLSFIICQLAVDLSNIAGASFQKFFTDMASNIPIDAETASTLASADNPSATWFKTLFTTISGGVVVLGGASVVSSALNGGLINGILIPVLLAFIVALIAVLFFFILLGARKAGIIILIVIAPLAFVCYMLPNTKKFFDKWWKAFSGLLLVYPLCGVLLGGSQFASRLIINSSTDYIMYFVGAMLLVVPYFFVPTLIKGSFAALGNLGAKISSFGQKFGQRTRGRADNTIKNSNRYKARQTDAAFRTQRRQDNLNRRRSDRVVNRYGSRNPSSLNKRQRLALLNAQRTQARLNSQEQKDYSDQFANISDIPTMQSTLNAALARGNSNEIAAALAVAESKGMESQIFSALRSSPSAVMNNSAVMAQLAQSKNKVLRAYGKKGSGVDYNTFLTGTGPNSLSGYAASKGEGFLDGLDDKALEEMASHGGANALTNSMLMKAAASAKDQSSVAAIDKMFAGRTFSQNDFTAENISQFKESTVRSIMASGSANAKALAAASDSLANNPQNAQLVARMDGATKARLNTLRRALGRTVIT